MASGFFDCPLYSAEGTDGYSFVRSVGFFVPFSRDWAQKNRAGEGAVSKSRGGYFITAAVFSLRLISFFKFLIHRSGSLALPRLMDFE